MHYLYYGILLYVLAVCLLLYKASCFYSFELISPHNRKPWCVSLTKSNAPANEEIVICFQSSREFIFNKCAHFKLATPVAMLRHLRAFG